MGKFYLKRFCYNAVNRTDVKYSPREKQAMNALRGAFKLIFFHVSQVYI